MVVTGAMSAVIEDKKFVQSLRSDKMRLFRRNLLTKVMEGTIKRLAKK